MSANKQLVAFATAFAVLAVPVFVAAAQAKSFTSHRPMVHRTIHHPMYAGQWRHRTTRGWDNTCLDLPYLASQFACDAK